MKIKPLKLVLLVLLMILFIFSFALKDRKKEGSMLLLPSLPKPIAKEYVLITSAGQGTDAYIVNDMVNKLMIHNYFMPQAQEADLEGVNTLVFVVGYSAMGEKMHKLNYQDEKNRIIGLLQGAKNKKQVIITIYAGGENKMDKKTEELLRLISSESDYIIATKEANKNGLLSELARSKRVPLTLVNGVGNLSEPFASAFR